jgi:DNA-binding NtrC family response regulator
MKKIKLLIVDDQEVYLRSLEYVLTKHFDVITVSNYDDAIAVLTKNGISAALLDIRLNETDEMNTDGLKILEWIFTNNQSISVFMMSAYNEFVYAEKALNWGAKHFFRKPIDILDLITVLNQKA